MEERRTGNGYSTVSLQPFVHQVGGHSSIQQFDQYTVCKPLFSKELRFYEEVCPAFKPFIPEFKGKSRCCLFIFTGKMLTIFMFIQDVRNLSLFGATIKWPCNCKLTFKDTNTNRKVVKIESL